MGKSLGNAIYLSDTTEEVNKKVMTAVTDPNRIKKMILEPQMCVWFHIIIIYLVLNKSTKLFVKNAKQEKEVVWLVKTTGSKHK